MTLIEAIKTKKKFKRQRRLDSYQYFDAGTGPFNSLVSCDYFVIYEDNESSFFSTSLDLYASDILATDYVIEA